MRIVFFIGLLRARLWSLKSSSNFSLENFLSQIQFQDQSLFLFVTFILKYCSYLSYHNFKKRGHTTINLNYFPCSENCSYQLFFRTGVWSLKFYKNLSSILNLFREVLISRSIHFDAVLICYLLKCPTIKKMFS